MATITEQHGTYDALYSLTEMAEALGIDERDRLPRSRAVAFKHADPLSDARWIYDEHEAQSIASEDPSLIMWVDD